MRLFEVLNLEILNYQNLEWDHLRIKAKKKLSKFCSRKTFDSKKIFAGGSKSGNQAITWNLDEDKDYKRLQDSDYFSDKHSKVHSRKCSLNIKKVFLEDYEKFSFQSQQSSSSSDREQMKNNNTFSTKITIKNPSLRQAQLSSKMTSISNNQI